ncbi:PepSY domain-containing protein [Desulfothermobacter acidiphilus]|uniref:PepSY domain-containing protein n=1 Tax=Desulfothermobacter acidiphilus TaxID=1938353 RepID=UPI003F8CC12B
MKKLVGYLAAGLFAATAVTGMGFGLVKAKANTGAIPGATPAAVQNQANTQVEEQQPNYTGSIRVNEPQQDNEQAEAQYLQSLAKITPDQARAAALQAVSGQVKKVDLDNENGYLVYSVEVQTATGLVDVKVDAGDGKVLAKDSGQDSEKGGKEAKAEAERDAAPEAPETGR